ncbi:MAG: putative Ig domain-containing protein [Polyangiaceae bacterium]
MAGDASVELELEIAPSTFTAGKTYLPFTGKIRASGAAHYSWSITSGTLPAGLTLQGAQTATVSIAGTPTEAGQFPIGLSVTDGSATKAVDVTLVITHSALFLSDRNITGVNELFLAELGAGTASAPVQLSASIPAGGGITSYAWSPDGSKVLYLATQSAGGTAELWVASIATPGTAQRVSAAGVIVKNMVWLLSGNIAAYNTSTGDAYLVDLSASTPGASKLAVSGPASPGSLTPSPNGIAVGIWTFDFDTTVQGNLFSLQYVTWSGGSPKSSAVQDKTVNNTLQFSYDGQFSITSGFLGSVFWNLSVAPPTQGNLSDSVSPITTWSPSAQALLYFHRDSEDTITLYRGVFNGGALTPTPLLSTPFPATCVPSARPWSPDGKQVLFQCGNDLRAISNFMTAASNTDFSVLPSDFLSNAFTDVATVGWSPDSKWIALRADRNVSTSYDLTLIRWSAPGVAYKPHANSFASGVATWAFAQDSQSVALVGTIAPQSNPGLYLSRLPASGAPSSATLVSLPTSSVQTDINWLPGSRVITYRATVSGAARLFTVPIAADGTAGSPVSINGENAGAVSSYQLAPAR